jgi:hypothetical protein
MDGYKTSEVGKEKSTLEKTVDSYEKREIENEASEKIRKKTKKHNK